MLPLLVVDAAMRPKYFTCQANGIAEFGAGVMTEQLTGRCVAEDKGSSYGSYIARRGQRMRAQCNERAVESVDSNSNSSKKSGGP